MCKYLSKNVYATIRSNIMISFRADIRMVTQLLSVDLA